MSHNLDRISQVLHSGYNSKSLPPWICDPSFPPSCYPSFPGAYILPSSFDFSFLNLTGQLAFKIISSSITGALFEFPVEALEFSRFIFFSLTTSITDTSLGSYFHPVIIKMSPPAAKTEQPAQMKREFPSIKKESSPPVMSPGTIKSEPSTHGNASPAKNGKDSEREGISLFIPSNNI